MAETAGVTSKAGRWPYVALAVAVVVIVGVGGLHDWHRGRLIPVEERKAMPPLVLPLLDGGTWRLEEHRGQVIVVNYWASWCAPCWEETPMLMKLFREDSANGLAVVGVAMDESGTDKVRAFVARFRVNYPIALPQPMSQMVYGLGGLPTTILVDRQGRVAKIYSGAMRERDLRADINILLAER
jgi:cytochrome c biogenesis protein CcmG, thiol:disulfide interchange protein DsbE